MLRLNHASYLRSSRPVLTLRSVRSFTSTNASLKKHEYLVILPDKEGALETRRKVRPQHIEELRVQVDNGFIQAGGAWQTHIEEEGEKPNVEGSVLIVLAESRAEVEEKLKKDKFTTSGVWDWDNVKIHPFKSAIRTPKSLT